MLSYGKTWMPIRLEQEYIWETGENKNGILDKNKKRENEVISTIRR
jgi:hypothetical protein